MRHAGTVRKAAFCCIALLLAFQILRLMGFVGSDVILLALTVLSILLACLLLVMDESDWIARLRSDSEAEKNWPAWWIYTALGLIVLAGIFLKLIHIENIGVYTDEWGSLVNAKSIAESGGTIYTMNGVATEPYSRALFLLYLTGYFIRMFGQSLLVARLPVIILSSLTAVPLYFLGAKISRKVGLFSALLWLMSPWGLMIGRFVREYAVFPLFYLLIFCMFTVFANHALKHLESGQPLCLRDWIVGGLGSLFPLYYMLIVDKFSTFEQVLVIYAVSFLYMIFIVLNSKGARRLVTRKVQQFGILAFLLALLTYIYMNRFGISWWELSSFPHYSSTWPGKILGDHSRSWFYMTGTYSVYLVMALGTFGPLILFIRRKIPFAFFYILPFYATFYVYTFHFSRYIRPRYGFVMHVFLIPVLAVGIYFLYLLLYRKGGQRNLGSVLFILLILFTFNPVNTYNAVFDRGSRYDFITEEHLYQFGEVAEKYGADMKDQVILCTTCQPLFWYKIADLQENKVTKLAIHSDDMKAAESIIVASREAHEHGWIILDQWRFRSEGLILEKPIMAQGYVFDYVDHLSSFFLYKW